MIGYIAIHHITCTNKHIQQTFDLTLNSSESHTVRGFTEETTAHCLMSNFLPSSMSSGFSMYFWAGGETRR